MNQDLRPEGWKRMRILEMHDLTAVHLSQTHIYTNEALTTEVTQPCVSDARDLQHYAYLHVGRDNVVEK